MTTSSSLGSQERDQTRRLTQPMDQKYKRKGKHSAFVNLTMSTNIISSSTEKLNLTMEQINELLRSLTNKSSLFNQTIEHNFNIYDLINFSLEGILLPLLCLIGLTGRPFFLHSLSLVTDGIDVANLSNCH